MKDSFLLLRARSWSGDCWKAKLTVFLGEHNGTAFVQRQDALEVHTSLVSIIGILEVIESDSSKSTVDLTRPGG